MDEPAPKKDHQAEALQFSVPILLFRPPSATGGEKKVAVVGTGAFISASPPLLLTAKHVLGDIEDGRLVPADCLVVIEATPDGQRVESLATEIYCLEGYDVAVVRVDRAWETTTVVTPVAEQRAAIGERVIAVGYPESIPEENITHQVGTSAIKHSVGNYGEVRRILITTHKPTPVVDDESGHSHSGDDIAPHPGLPSTPFDLIVGIQLGHQVCAGTVEAIDERGMLTLDEVYRVRMSISGGLSGAPTRNAAGEIVGIVTSSDPAEQSGSIAIVTPEFLEALRLPGGVSD